ncbi:MAG: hypothetical protein ACUVX8_05865 [Candidatus Zipacnadales bacterium]
MTFDKRPPEPPPAKEDEPLTDLLERKYHATSRWRRWLIATLGTTILLELAPLTPAGQSSCKQVASFLIEDQEPRQGMSSRDVDKDGVGESILGNGCPLSLRNTASSAVSSISLDKFKDLHTSIATRIPPAQTGNVRDSLIAGNNPAASSPTSDADSLTQGLAVIALHPDGSTDWIRSLFSLSCAWYHTTLNAANLNGEGRGEWIASVLDGTARLYDKNSHELPEYALGREICHLSVCVPPAKGHKPQL